jgi:ribosomal protein S14
MRGRPSKLCQTYCEGSHEEFGQGKFRGVQLGNISVQRPVFQKRGPGVVCLGKTSASRLCHDSTPTATENLRPKFGVGCVLSISINSLLPFRTRRTRRQHRRDKLPAMRLSGIQKEVLSLYRQCLREAAKKPAVSSLQRHPWCTRSKWTFAGCTT